MFVGAPCVYGAEKTPSGKTPTTSTERVGAGVVDAQGVDAGGVLRNPQSVEIPFVWKNREEASFFTQFARNADSSTRGRSAPLLRSGALWESEHFSIRVVSKECVSEQKLTQLVWRAEETLREAEAVAKLWRSEVDSLEKTRQKSASKTLLVLHDGEYLDDLGGGVCVPECQFFPNDKTLSLNLHAADSPKFSLAMREAIFRQTLHSGGEAERFPLWVQEGLALIFRGETLPTTEGVSKVASLEQLARVGNLPQDARQREWFQREAFLATSYFLRANEGRTFERFLRAIGDFLNDDSSHAQRQFLQTLEGWSAEQNMVPFDKWVQNPNKSDLAILWDRYVPLLNGRKGEIIEMTDEMRNMLVECAILLCVAQQYEQMVAQNSPPEEKKSTPNGVKVVEFGAKPTPVENVGGNGDEKAEKELEEDADLKRLGNVYRWFSDVENPQSFILPNGEAIGAACDASVVRRLFYPPGRRYLLQYYREHLVLAATFDNGEAAYVELLPTEGGRVVRILGFEEAETPQN
ncbi:MAG: hypothetical protein Q4D38_11235 [Planctomycetia bacterium]|nr:hypothetical protein [Planctomycetia bacterium]